MGAVKVVFPRVSAPDGGTVRRELPHWNVHLSDPQTLANLPPRLTTLDVLAGVTVEVTQAGIQSGAIHPEMTAKEAREFVRLHTGTSTQKRIAPPFNIAKRLIRVEKSLKDETLKWPGNARCQLADLLEGLAKNLRADLPPIQ